jgi:hypothetical protein
MHKLVVLRVLTENETEGEQSLSVFIERERVVDDE